VGSVVGKKDYPNIVGNPNQESNYDAALFSFSVFLSSYFLYNSVGEIDDRAIQQLQFVLSFLFPSSTKLLIQIYIEFT
jgi:Guanylate-binding protein, N-terminal domain